MNTVEFAQQHDICVEANCPPVADWDEPCVRFAEDIAVRAIILQGVVAVAAYVDQEPIISWLKREALWSEVTPQERSFFTSRERSEEICRKYQWHMEAEWALLWMIGKVESLGLPTKPCESGRLVDEIIPALDSDTSEFINSASIRSPGEILAEDDRTYDLWCQLHMARKNRVPIPDDLNYGVLYERRYAFEWLDGHQEWDDVTCDT